MTRDRVTDQLTSNAGIELFDRPPIRMCGQCTLRSFVRGTIERVDRLCKAELCGRHGYMRASGDSCGEAVMGAEKARKRTTHRVQVGLAVLLKDATFLLKPVRGELSRRDSSDPGKGEETGTHTLYFASSDEKSWSTVRSIWPVFCRSYEGQVWYIDT